MIENDGSQGAQRLFEVAHRGTLFLDEIGDLAPEVQPKPLKLLEEKQFRRLGEVRERCSDVRLLAATHRDLGRAVSEQRFRADLYYRSPRRPLRTGRSTRRCATTSNRCSRTSEATSSPLRRRSACRGRRSTVTSRAIESTFEVGVLKVATVPLMKDEAAVAFPLRRYLARLGLEVDWARELDEAQAMLVHFPYPVVIADLRLGGSHHCEDLDLLAYVHRHSSDRRVILLTAYFTPEIEAEALRWGAVAVLRKLQSLADISRFILDLLGVAP